MTRNSGNSLHIENHLRGYSLGSIQPGPDMTLTNRLPSALCQRSRQGGLAPRDFDSRQQALVIDMLHTRQRLLP